MYTNFKLFENSLNENLSVEAKSAIQLILAGGDENRELLKYLYIGNPDIKNELEQRYKYLMGYFKIQYFENLFFMESVEMRNVTEIPIELFDFVNISELRLYGSFSVIPSEIGNLQRLGHLTIESKNIQEIPKEIKNCENLSMLSISGGMITKLPVELFEFPKLRRLFLSKNAITEIPKEIQNLTFLKELSLGFNNLKTLPKEIAKLKNLSSLGLYGNNGIVLPKEIYKMKNLRIQIEK